MLKDKDEGVEKVVSDIDSSLILQHFDDMAGFGINQLRLHRMFDHLEAIYESARLSDLTVGVDIVFGGNYKPYVRFEAKEIADHWGMSERSLKTNYVKPLKKMGLIEVTHRGKKDRQTFFRPSRS